VAGSGAAGRDPHPGDVDGLAVVLAWHTSTPERCWFCVWDGWGSIVFEDGPRVQLPAREYVLFVGPLAGLPSLMEAQGGRSPNLWWPEDRASCVATEIDLAFTYVGGLATLISDVLGDPRLEAQPAMPDDFHQVRAPQWLVSVIEAAATELLDSGTATIDTWRGTVDAQLQLPHGQTDGDLRIQRRPANGFAGSGWSRVSEHDPVRLRNNNVTVALTLAVIELL
jgi:hypothetical protein